jgi:pullulanase
VWIGLGGALVNPAIFEIRKSSFVLWRPALVEPAPLLVIGRFQDGNPRTLADRATFPLERDVNRPDLWVIDAVTCGLVDGTVYHYWFELTDSNPARNGRRILCTDPFAHTVDWRLRGEPLPAPYGPQDQDPAAVVKFEGGELVPCDVSGETFGRPIALDVAQAKSNIQLVIYELPTTWTKRNIHGDPELGIGTFRDVLALVQSHSSSPGFRDVAALEAGRSHLEELGVTGLELLPIADSFVEREWGYATSNYLAPDYDLGRAAGNAWSTSSTDLVALITACHERGIRFIIDVVMAFGTRASLENINYSEFHIDPGRSPGDPDIQQSGGQGIRNGFGGELFRYGYSAQITDPVSGNAGTYSPARQYMETYLLRWMNDFAVGGIRIDSVNNVANWDFVQEYKDTARAAWAADGGSADQFIVVGEELSVPLELLAQNRLDGLWNPRFASRVRNAILGNSDEGSSFDETVRRMIDARQVGFADGAEVVNYLGSHDVEGFRNERLYNFLDINGVVFKEKHIKLAFVCLLTAVGIPMILAGDEFADEHDLQVVHPDKQRDAVNFERLQDPWRRRIFEYTARLVRLRTSYPALAVNDTEFLHIDLNGGKRVLAWRRGQPGSDSQIVVVANFSDWANLGAPGAEYIINNWPATPNGRRWREMTQERNIPLEWVGREPLAAREAKVYALVDV